jgi:hypothetical protein
MGVAPEHVCASCHCPFASQVCVVSVAPGLQRFAPVVHTRHEPALHVPASPLTAHAVPLALLAISQELPVHVAWRHGFAGCVHCGAVVHSTQVVVAALQ